ncbi:predicted protein [Phaeodactylum tricornutum CCAP 1055/1]|uniref:Uncharacterized protein n=1 Tax=Phaeodactylum tricornutum (strain CCAP 1055/1) TaxID=556484 RepID=B7G2S8_PHATC|nr:predicted protein [Phaeodactylum tricornutum CCAP 1055/1]EEC47359.1 predicted protein [Phaeodactylum tricornutum CCAP 1055/1]|eukprot:XP_002181436.1 predicted protein [Phaeodactylum tricornutum CCAP 1055/1]
MGGRSKRPSGGRMLRIIAAVLVLCLWAFKFPILFDESIDRAKDSPATHSSSGNNWDFLTLPQTPLAANQNLIQIEFDWINARLLGPDSYGGTDKCSLCGCPGVPTPRDCPQWYTVEDIQDSVHFMDDHSDVLIPHSRALLNKRRLEAEGDCQVKEVTQARGGWCLTPNPKGEKMTTANGSFLVPFHHVPPAKRLVDEIDKLIRDEDVRSIVDFGAGVGQYKLALTERHPDLQYYAYDGAGNAVNYTNDYLEYFDLTIPLGLPKADWVLSLEVGEHVPSKYEGMVLRNLHRHNCKGIILSWGVLGQGGYGHVNNHSNDYIIKVIEQLGYVLDQKLTARFQQAKDNYWWFKKSTMAFRRTTEVC